MTDQRSHEYEGRRVRFLFTSDPYTRLTAGTLGTVRLVDSLGTVHVSWDDGSTLGMVPDAGDRFEYLPMNERSHVCMTPDLIRSMTPTGTNRNVTVHPPSRSAFTVYGTVVEHSHDTLYLGVHPDLLAIPYADIEAVTVATGTSDRAETWRLADAGHIGAQEALADEDACRACDEWTYGDGLQCEIHGEEALLRLERDADDEPDDDHNPGDDPPDGDRGVNSARAFRARKRGEVKK